MCVMQMLTCQGILLERRTFSKLSLSGEVLVRASVSSEVMEGVEAEAATAGCSCRLGDSCIGMPQERRVRNHRRLLT